MIDHNITALHFLVPAAQIKMYKLQNPGSPRCGQSWRSRTTKRSADRDRMNHVHSLIMVHLRSNHRAHPNLMWSLEGVRRRTATGNMGVSKILGSLYNYVEKQEESLMRLLYNSAVH